MEDFPKMPDPSLCATCSKPMSECVCPKTTSEGSGPKSTVDLSGQPSREQMATGLDGETGELIK